MYAAGLNMLAEFIDAIARKCLSQGASLTPDILNEGVAKVEFVLVVIQLIVLLALFFRAFKQIKYYRNLIDAEDEELMAQLQREVLPDKLSTLPIKSIEILTKVWAAILIAVRVVYELTSTAYRALIAQLTNMINMADAQAYMAFVAFYNSSHGFKYAGMLIAIGIGIFVTGVFLRDRFLILSSLGLVTVFIFAFIFVNRSQFFIGTTALGIVWTSVIFHLIQTVGLFVMAFYMRKKYRGL